MKVNKKDWKFFVPLILGIFLLTNEILWIFLSGSGKFNGDPEQSSSEFDFHDVFGVFYMLAYFTTQSNLFLGVMFIIIAFCQTNRAYSWYVGSAMLMVITFFAFWSLLFDPNNKILEWSDPYFVTSTLFTHGVNPITGFIFLIVIRKQIIVNRRIVGLTSMYMMVYYMFNGLLFTIASNVLDGKFNPVSVYTFLRMDALFLIDFTNSSALGILANLTLFIVCPLFPLSCAFVSLKMLKIKTEAKSYYRWMDWIKLKIKNCKAKKQQQKMVDANDDTGSSSNSI